MALEHSTSVARVRAAFDNVYDAERTRAAVIKDAFPVGVVVHAEWGGKLLGPYKVKDHSTDQVYLYNPATGKYRWMCATFLR